MSSRISGWLSTVVEVCWAGTDEQFQDFIIRVNGIAYAELLSVASGGAPNAAIFPDQEENSHFVRIECPHAVSHVVLLQLHEAAAAAFRPPPG